MKLSEWTNCYDEGWKGVIVPEAFAHPAKMSYGLLKRILDHAKGWLKEGDVIVDPFGGIGSTGILGAYEGYQVVCVELEAKFFDLALLNFELHDNAWSKLGCIRPHIIQGDSRRLCEVVEKADCIISSPPFLDAKTGDETIGQNTQIVRHSERAGGISPKATGTRRYGNTKGQLGSMKPGKVDMVVSSPPYAETLKGDGTQKETAAESRAKRLTPGGSLGQSQRTQGYGSKGNLGNLKSGDVSVILSSPPYEGSMTAGGHLVWQNQGKIGAHKKSKGNEEIYGKSANQLGNQQGDTFWQAAKTIVEQCFQILKPGGHAIWVVKSFVRNKKIVDFPGDWQRLCESVGFKTVCVHHAMLVKETTHKTLFGHTEVKRTERKSFFRRLAESKGSPRIDFEVVLCMDKQPLFPVETKK